MPSNDSTLSTAYTIELSPRAFADIDAIVEDFARDARQFIRQEKSKDKQR